MKSDLQSLLNQINGIPAYNPDIFQQYRMLVKQCADRIQSYNIDDHNPMLMAWVNMGLEELQKETQVRLNDNFTSLPIDKQKTEFMYSRSTVTMSLTNIIMNL